MDGEKFNLKGFFLFSLAIGSGIIMAGILGFVAMQLHINFWQKKMVPGQVPPAQS